MTGLEGSVTLDATNMKSRMMITICPSRFNVSENFHASHQQASMQTSLNSCNTEPHATSTMNSHSSCKWHVILMNFMQSVYQWDRAWQRMGRNHLHARIL